MATKGPATNNPRILQSGVGPRNSSPARQQFRGVNQALGQYLRTLDQLYVGGQDPEDLTRILMYEAGECDAIDQVSFPTSTPVQTSVIKDAAFGLQIAGGPYPGQPYYRDSTIPGVPLITGQNIGGGDGADTSGMQSGGISPDGVTLGPGTGEDAGTTLSFDPSSGLYYLDNGGAPGSGFFTYDAGTATFSPVPAPHGAGGTPPPLPYVTAISEVPYGAIGQVPYGGVPFQPGPHRGLVTEGTAPSGDALGWTHSVDGSGVTHEQWIGYDETALVHYIFDAAANTGGWKSWNGTGWDPADPPASTQPTKLGGQPDPIVNQPAFAVLINRFYPPDPGDNPLNPGSPAPAGRAMTGKKSPAYGSKAGVTSDETGGIGVSLAVVSGMELANPDHPGLRARVDDASIKIDSENYLYAVDTSASEKPGPGIMFDPPTPADAPTGSTEAGTTLGIGVYQYWYTDITPKGEGPLSPVLSLTTIGGQQQTSVTIPEGGYWAITARNLYRSRAGGNVARKHPTAVPGRGAVTITDATHDADLGARYAGAAKTVEARIPLDETVVTFGKPKPMPGGLTREQRRIDALGAVHLDALAVKLAAYDDTASAGGSAIGGAMVAGA